MAIPNAKDTHNRVSNISNIISVHRDLLRYKRQGIQRQAWNQLKIGQNNTTTKLMEVKNKINISIEKDNLYAQVLSKRFARAR